MTWKILRENAPGVFDDTGERFVCDTAEQVQLYLDALKDASGICHAAELESD